MFRYLDLVFRQSEHREANMGFVNFLLIYSPICMAISPMAQVALLHTEINSGFRFRPRMGINSAGNNTHKKTILIHIQTSVGSRVLKNTHQCRA